MQRFAKQLLDEMDADDFSDFDNATETNIEENTENPKSGEATSVKFNARQLAALKWLQENNPEYFNTRRRAFEVFHNHEVSHTVGRPLPAANPKLILATPTRRGASVRLAKQIATETEDRGIFVPTTYQDLRRIHRLGENDPFEPVGTSCPTKLHNFCL